MYEIVWVIIWNILFVTASAIYCCLEVKHRKLMNKAFTLIAFRIYLLFKTFTFNSLTIIHEIAVDQFKNAHNGFASITLGIQIKQWLQIEELEQFWP
jgi:hypothetical protein